MDDSITMQSPAKINLGLRVGPETKNGYHRIRTVFQTISFYDELTFQVSNSRSDKLNTTGPIEVPSNSDNLILRTLKLVRKRGLSLPSLTVTLEKNVPVQSGLGGGSSNAATVLKAVSHFVDGSFDRATIQSLAREIGADVPFFLEGGTSLGTNRGDQLSPLTSLTGQGILCVPPYGVSTEWAYENVRSSPEDELDGIIPEDDSSDIHSWEELDLTNDFEPLVAQHYDQHREINRALTEFASRTALTGSGSALYALLDPTAKCSRIVDKLSGAFEGCRWYQFEFITRDRSMRGWTMNVN